MLTVTAVFSYLIAAAAFFALFVLLITRWRDRLHGMTLMAVCFVTALWAATVAVQIAWGNTFWLLTDLLEIARNAGWTIFLLILLSPSRQKKALPSFTFKPFVGIVASLYMALALAIIYTYLRFEFLHGAIAFLSSIVGRVALAVIGMILVEQLFRSTSEKQRWGIKFACFGIGGLFAYDFYLYSDAMLFRKINIEIWTARGLVNALIVPLIAISAARNPQWSTGISISVSRRILFHSAALFGSAIYLLTMAAAGYYLRFFGGSWGTIMQVAFLFGAGVLLVVVLLSGSFRSKLKVFISKHFYNYNYDYREEWLRFTRILSEEGPGLEERAIQAVTELVESPGGALWIKRESGYCEPAAHLNMSLPGEAEPANSSFCQFLQDKQWVVDLEEYDAYPDRYGTMAMPQWLTSFPNARLVVPLILHGSLFGFVVLAQPRSQIKLNWEVIDLLKIAGSQAASYLAQQNSANALMVARQFESFNRMSTFMVHDLKNLVSQLSLLVSNAEKHKDSPEFQRDMLDTVDHSVQKMKLLLQKLTRSSSVERPAPLFMDKLLKQAVASKSAFEPKPALEILDADLIVFANWERLERVIGHIIQNAIEATARDGRVMVRLMQQDGAAVVELQDTGQGMSEEFIRERLFKPFESTKSAGMGIGVFESREYIHELGGKLEVASQQSIGTTFRMILPLHTHDDSALKAA